MFLKIGSYFNRFNCLIDSGALCSLVHSNHTKLTEITPLVSNVRVLSATDDPVKLCGTTEKEIYFTRNGKPLLHRFFVSSKKIMISFLGATFTFNTAQL